MIKINSKWIVLASVGGVILTPQELFSKTINIEQQGEVIYENNISSTLSRKGSMNIVSQLDYNKIRAFSDAYNPVDYAELKDFLKQMYANKEPYYLVKLNKTTFREEYESSQLKVNDLIRDSVFSLPNLNWSYSLIKENDSITFIITPAYFESEARLKARNLFVEKLAKEIEANYDSDIEKVYALYSYIIRHTTYDYDTPIQEDGASENVEAAMATTLILKNKAVCQAYTELFSLVADKLGIENTVMTGYIKEGDNPNLNYYHSWNKVKVDEEWYNLDATWGDYNFMLGDNLEENGINTRASYFLFSDKVASLTRESEFSDTPRATSEKYDFFHDKVGNYGLDSGIYDGKIALSTMFGLEVYDLRSLERIFYEDANPNSIVVANQYVYYKLWGNESEIYIYNIETNEKRLWKSGMNLLGANKDGIHAIASNKKIILPFINDDGFSTTTFKIGVEKNTDNVFKAKTVVSEIQNNTHIYKKFSKSKSNNLLKNETTTPLLVNGLQMDLIRNKITITDKGLKNEAINVILYNESKDTFVPFDFNSLGDYLEIYPLNRLLLNDSYKLFLIKNDTKMAMNIKIVKEFHIKIL